MHIPYSRAQFYVFLLTFLRTQPQGLRPSAFGLHPKTTTARKREKDQQRGFAPRPPAFTPKQQQRASARKTIQRGFAPRPMASPKTTPGATPLSLRLSPNSSADARYKKDTTQKSVIPDTYSQYILLNPSSEKIDYSTSPKNWYHCSCYVAGPAGGGPDIGGRFALRAKSSAIPSMWRLRAPLTCRLPPTRHWLLKLCCLAFRMTSTNWPSDALGAHAVIMPAPAWRAPRHRAHARLGLVQHRRRRPGRARYALHLADIEQLVTWSAGRPRGDRVSAGLAAATASSAPWWWIFAGGVDLGRARCAL